MGRLKLRFVLSVDDGEDADDYTLQVYCSGHPSQTVTFNTSSFQGSVTLDFKGSPPFVHFWLYVLDRADDTDGATTECSLASSCIPLLDVVRATSYISLPLLDITRAEQAKLQVCPAQPVSELPTWARSLPRVPTLLPNPDYLATVVDSTRQAYEGLSCQDDLQRFETITTHVGDIPIACFAVLATMYQESQKRQGELFLVHTLQLGCRLRNIPLDGIDNLSHIDAGNLLGEVCCWLPRCLLYVCDFTRVKGETGSIRKSLTDEWSILGDFPHLGRAGFDCEDGSCFVLAMLHLLNTVTTEYGPLQALQRVRQRYNAFFALGQLYDGADSHNRPHYVAHALVILLDKRYVGEAMLGGERSHGALYPGLAVESTNWTESAWCTKYWKSGNSKTRANVFHRSDRLFDLTKNDPQRSDQWKRMIKCCIPSSVLHSRKMYGDVAMLVATDMGVFHALMLNQSGNGVGINISELLLQSRRSDICRVILHLTHPQEINRLSGALCEMPIARLPTVPQQWVFDKHQHSLLYPPDPQQTGNAFMQYTMRAEDYEQHKDEVNALISCMGTGASCAVQTVSEDAAFMMMQVPI